MGTQRGMCAGHTCLAMDCPHFCTASTKKPHLWVRLGLPTSRFTLRVGDATLPVPGVCDCAVDTGVQCLLMLCDVLNVMQGKGSFSDRKRWCSDKIFMPFWDSGVGRAQAH